MSLEGSLRVEAIYLEEIITQLGKMKINKVCGPDCLLGVLNEAMRKGIF